jgi:hypothetical protein
MLRWNPNGKPDWADLPIKPDFDLLGWLWRTVRIRGSSERQQHQGAGDEATRGPSRPRNPRVTASLAPISCHDGSTPSARTRLKSMPKEAVDGTHKVRD